MKLRPLIVKLFLAVLVAGAAGAFLSLSARGQNSALTRSQAGEKSFDVRRVRGPYEMDDIQGVATVGDDSGCFVVWNKKRVECFRVGMVAGSVFDCVRIWGEDFGSVRSVVPVGGGASTFVVHTKDNIYVYKADWYPNY